MNADWNRTIIMRRRINGDYYQGRPVIHRDTPIDGGVYLGAHEREAIVVDSNKYPKIEELYQKAKERLDTADEFDVLKSVYETVDEAFPIKSEEALERLLNHYDIGPDQKVSLDLFIKHGVGVCRHMALTAGALLELFKKEGYIDGEISIDRNTTELGGHSWVRYNNGEVYIVDPAIGYLGKLKDGLHLWSYARPEDQ